MALRKLLLLVALAGLAAGATSFVRAPRPYAGPLDVSFWYWHRPFKISRQEAKQLREMGVKRLFVHAGTFSTTGGLHLTLPQEWTRRADQEIVLVFNAHTDLLRDFGKIPNVTLSRGMSAQIRDGVDRAKRAGIQVTGVQLDIDSPTRLLGKYAGMLGRMREAIRPLEFSITALPTWYRSPRIREIAAAVDFIVPQYYEAETPRDVKEFVPISSSNRLKAGLCAAGSLGTPFYAGLPAYGHALVYSGTGKLLGGYHDMSVAEALRHPAMKLLENYPVDAKGRRANEATYIGEDVYRFVPKDMRLDDPDAHDQPDHGMGRKPYYLVYDVPSPTMIAQNLQVLRENRPANCRGVILYRLPERGEIMALPLAACAAALCGANPGAHLTFAVEKEEPVWDVIDTGSGVKNSTKAFNLIVSNDGSAATGVGPRAVEIHMILDRARIESACPGSFDSIVSLLWDGSSEPMKCSLKSANTLRFSKVFLGAGEKARIGPIYVEKKGPKCATIEWSIQEAGGFARPCGRTEVPLN
jgi:hypothetical protein